MERRPGQLQRRRKGYWRERKWDCNGRQTRHVCWRMPFQTNAPLNYPISVDEMCFDENNSNINTANNFYHIFWMNCRMTRLRCTLRLDLEAQRTFLFCCTTEHHQMPEQRMATLRCTMPQPLARKMCSSCCWSTEQALTSRTRYPPDLPCRS